MYDSTGVGWNAHMGFGTSVLLDALGPGAFCAPQSFAIYREIRLFEISRAALFQQSTVLASDRWLLFDQSYRTAGGEGTVLEAAFDLFLKLVDLQQRFVAVRIPGPTRTTTDIIPNRATGQEQSPYTEHCTLAMSARSIHSQLNHFNHTLTTSAPTPSTNIACIYYHAMSIYLSGLCDYQVLPDEVDLSLPEEEIQHHAESIISRCGKALNDGQVSVVLLLLPLRIAGNRCRTTDGCGEILRLLERIEGGFGVAASFKGELIGIWAEREDMTSLL
jgi:hypothetical protein